MPAVIMPVRTLHEGREWPGDEKAVARFLGGDLTAFDLIVRQYSGMIFALASRLVGPWEAEEVVQETFLRAWRGLESFRGDASLKTWLYTIALNRCEGRARDPGPMRKVFVSPRQSRG
ncbi:MAG: hypothetical protein IPP07_21255 [Holophagales bacterium]|nr:hypothetical protein [Holophagales bacterium]